MNIKINELRRHSGAVLATFAANVGDVTIPGCALVRRGDGAALSLPRVGQPGATRPVSLAPDVAAELERLALEAVVSAPAIGEAELAVLEAAGL